MSNDELIINFLRFLKEEKIYKKFLRHYYTNNARKKVKVSFIEFLMECHKSNFVRQPISWFLTEEGYGFWASINIKWQHCIYKD